MKIKLESSTKKNHFIYGDFSENLAAKGVIIFISGFSGGRDLPLFKDATSYFLKNNFSTLCFNFCDDFEDKTPSQQALQLQDIVFSVYRQELKKIIDFLIKKDLNIFLVGHSFGAPVAATFLDHYRNYSKTIHLVLWEPTLLPWSRDVMEKEFTWDKSRELFIDKYTKESINATFYEECINTENTANIVGQLSSPVSIVAAKDSGDRDAEIYFLNLKNKDNSTLTIIDNTDHCFSGKEARQELFSQTLSYCARVKPVFP